MEIDAYVFATLAKNCNSTLGNLVTADIDGSTNKPLAALNNMFLYFANHEVPITEQIVFVSPAFMKQLRETTEVTKFLGQTDYNNKDIKFTITSYEGRRLVEVAPERFRTNIVIDDTGWGWDSSTSRPINFLGVSKGAVTHVTKYEKIKVIGDDLNLAGNGFDGYTIYARVYHDVFVADNKRFGVYASVASTDAKVAKLINVDLDSNDVVTGIVTYPNDNADYNYGYVVTTSSTAPSSLSDLTIYPIIDGAKLSYIPAAQASTGSDQYLWAVLYKGTTIAATQQIKKVAKASA